MEEGWWAAERVLGSELHAIADKARIVYEVAEPLSATSLLTIAGEIKYWCVSIAAFGFPVLPLVNCRFAMS
jgi:hypothetical protein